MTMQDVLYYIHTYGLIVLFLVVVGEYCIPGIPTGIVMPAAGIVAGQAHKGLIEVMLISLICGTVKVNFLKFMIFSIPGIFCWNFSGIVVGYLFGGKIVI